MAVTVIKERCPQNHPCPALSQCPVEAIVQHGYQAPEILEDLCISCGKCTRFCPMKALKLDNLN